MVTKEIKKVCDIKYFLLSSNLNLIFDIRLYLLYVNLNLSMFKPLFQTKCSQNGKKRSIIYRCNTRITENTR